MEATFRKSMAWLHTWAGILFGALLFAIFWTGTLSVFDEEIDRWMMPMTRLAPPPPSMSLDRLAPKFMAMTDGAPKVEIDLPTDRTPTLRVSWDDKNDREVLRHFDPRTGRILPSPGTNGATEFFYPFHFRLNIESSYLGRYVVGFATLFMLVLLISGAVVHKKIFREFFTFRPRKKAQRALLDLHNISGVIALPFHLIISASGVVIFLSVHLPSSWAMLYDSRDAFQAEQSGEFSRPAAGVPATLGSLDRMIGEARKHWDGGKAGEVRVAHRGDAAVYVEVRRAFDDRVTRDTQSVYFDGSGGSLLAKQHSSSVHDTIQYIEGLHRIEPDKWVLRWLYFAGGLSGCLLIGTGLLYWLQARRTRHDKLGLSGAKVVEAISVGSVVGIILASFAFLLTNRILPVPSGLSDAARAKMEIVAFFLVWVISFAHAALRGRIAWADQSFAVGLVALAAVLANWVTTDDHLLQSIATGKLAVAGVDMMLILSSMLGFYASYFLRNRLLMGNAGLRSAD